MAQRTAIGLTGDDLTVDDVWAVAVEGMGVELSDRARQRMNAARELVERAAHGSSEHTYGVNTGFGRFVAVAIPEEQTAELQLRLLRSHACGVGDPYPGEVRGTVDAVLKHIDLQTWRFAYQSQGRTTDPWLGPTVEATLDDLHREGHRHVLIAPIGFVSDHLEILYDIDIDFKKRAADKGMRLERIAMFNASPPLIDTLADVIAAHLKETDR